MIILVTEECAVLVVHCNLSISLELSRSGFSTLRDSLAIMSSFTWMKFDMWQPSGFMDVLIKCCGCNISGTWFVGVILVIAGHSEYVIVIYWFLIGYVKICNLLLRKNVRLLQRPFFLKTHTDRANF